MGERADGTRAIVVGGGLAGLSCAVELSTLGLQVTILESNAHVGGKMNVLSAEGFTFDMGPTILTLPQVIRGIIERSGRRVEDYLDIRPLDPQWRCFFEDGRVIDLHPEVERMARSLDEAFPSSDAGEGYRRFIAYSRRMYRLSEQVFFYKDLGGIADLMRAPPPREPGILRDVLAMRLHSTVGATAHGMIGEPHVRQLTEHFLQYVGSSPFLAPAILSLIAAAQVDHGCCYPMGGMRSIARALERVACEQGVHIEFGARVRKLETEKGRVRAAVLEDGRRLEADVFVSNCDVQRTMRDLLGTPEAKARGRAIARDYTPACSGLVLYLGLNRRYEALAHHNFLFSRDSKAEFADIYERGVPARDPSLYIAAPSRSDEGQAPPGCEALYVLIHTPYLRAGQEWHGAGGILARYRPVVIEKLKRMGMPDIEGCIRVEKHLTPNMIDRMYNAEGGAIYGLASHGRLKGGFKPRNRSLVCSNLYLAGGSANPGPGVPMVLMSGVTAARAVHEDLESSAAGGVRVARAREHARAGA